MRNETFNSTLDYLKKNNININNKNKKLNNKINNKIKKEKYLYNKLNVCIYSGISNITIKMATKHNITMAMTPILLAPCASDGSSVTCRVFCSVK